MSEGLIERAGKINETVASSYKAAFKNAYNKFRSYANPTNVQVATFISYLEKAEERQKQYDANAHQIMDHWRIYDEIVNDKRYPQNNKQLEKNRNKLWKHFGQMKRENGMLVEGSTADGTLKDCNTDVFVKQWNLFLKVSNSRSVSRDLTGPWPVKSRSAGYLPVQTLRSLAFEQKSGEAEMDYSDLKEALADDSDPTVREHVNGLDKIQDEDVRASTVATLEQVKKVKKPKKKNVCATKDCTSENPAKLYGDLCLECATKYWDDTDTVFNQRYLVYCEEHPEEQNTALHSLFKKYKEAKDRFDKSQGEVSG